MTAYSGLWNNEFGENFSQLPQSRAKGNDNVALSRVFANRLYGRGAMRAVIKALVAGNVGDPAVLTHKRVSGIGHGGARTIDTVTDINRNTTAADANEIVAALDQVNRPTSYPVDKSGNGGGSKLGW